MKFGSNPGQIDFATYIVHKWKQTCGSLLGESSQHKPCFELGVDIDNASYEIWKKSGSK